MSTVWLTLIKWFYGLDQLDEYRLQEVNQLGNNLFISYVVTSQVIFWVALIIYLPSQQFDKFSFILAVSYFLLLFIHLTKISHFLNEKDLLTIELEEMTLSDYRQKLRKRTLRSCLYLAIFYYLAPTLFDFFDSGRVDFYKLVTIKEIARAIITFSLFYILIYWSQLRKAKGKLRKG
ncbi:DUF3278 domain-containing protein [Streptococcus pluranimalium]|uniref:DUF3278 domain-containing protein n=1 Tax=Streptococcus pluranimalium TaxID=82348 RepID=UPI003138A4E4